MTIYSLPTDKLNLQIGEKIEFKYNGCVRRGIVSLVRRMTYDRLVTVDLTYDENYTSPIKGFYQNQMIDLKRV